MALIGTIKLPGDKSIGHRTLILSLLFPGNHTVTHCPKNQDVMATKACLEQLGVTFKALSDDRLALAVPKSLTQEPVTLDAQNSGTTMRLLSGLLTALNVRVTLTGDAALSQRPMKRVIEPLQHMNARIHGANNDTTAPITIHPQSEGLTGIEYTLPISSAQVKSALLLAGLFAKGDTQIVEPTPTRDHTERMLRFLDIPITVDGNRISVPGRFQPSAKSIDWTVPSDVSSAAFFMVGASLIPESKLTMTGVSLNPGRIGIIEALRHWGAAIDITHEQNLCGEPVGDVTVSSAALSGTLRIDETSQPALPSLIDEIPILAAAAAYVDGTLEVRGAQELRKKESDRISAIVQEFGKLGIAVTEFDDGFRIEGNPRRQIPPPAQTLSTHHDHRIAMALTILNRIAGSETWEIEGREWAEVSFPGFYDALDRLDSENRSEGAVH